MPAAGLRQHIRAGQRRARLRTHRHRGRSTQRQRHADPAPCVTGHRRAARRAAAGVFAGVSPPRVRCCCSPMAGRPGRSMPTTWCAISKCARYYIANNSVERPGWPALRVKALTEVGGAAQFRDEEILPGVEDLQVEFGVARAAADGATRVLYVAPGFCARAGRPRRRGAAVAADPRRCHRARVSGRPRVELRQRALHALARRSPAAPDIDRAHRRFAQCCAP